MPVPGAIARVKVKFLACTSAVKRASHRSKKSRRHSQSSGSRLIVPRKKVVEHQFLFTLDGAKKAVRVHMQEAQRDVVARRRQPAGPLTSFQLGDKRFPLFRAMTQNLEPGLQQALAFPANVLEKAAEA